MTWRPTWTPPGNDRACSYCKGMGQFHGEDCPWRDRMVADGLAPPHEPTPVMQGNTCEFCRLQVCPECRGSGFGGG